MITQALLSPKEMASKLGTTNKTVLEWYHTGIIPADIAIGRIYRFDESKVRSALAERSKKGAAQ